MKWLDKYMFNRMKIADCSYESMHDVFDRQGIAQDFMDGYSLSNILDRHTSEPEIKDNVMWFTHSPYGIRTERPCVDNSIMLMDHNTNEAIAIAFKEGDMK